MLMKSTQRDIAGETKRTCKRQKKERQTERPIYYKESTTAFERTIGKDLFALPLNFFRDQSNAEFLVRVRMMNLMDY